MIHWNFSFTSRTEKGNSVRRMADQDAIDNALLVAHFIYDSIDDDEEEGRGGEEETRTEGKVRQ